MIPICPICFEAKSTAFLQILSCGHFFCFKCLKLVEKRIDEYLECPQCREINTVVIEEINTEFKCTTCHKSILDRSCYILFCNHYVCKKCLSLKHMEHFFIECSEIHPNLAECKECNLGFEYFRV